MAISRRALLTGSLLAVAGCSRPTPLPTAPTPSPSPSPSASPTTTDLAVSSTIRALVGAGPFGTELVEGARNALPDGVTLATPTTDDVPTAFLHGAGVDLIHNTGTRRLALARASQHLADLTSILDEALDDGTPRRDRIRDMALTPGTVGGRQVAVHRLLVAHGIWYSDRDLSNLGATAPRTWDELVALGEAPGEGRHLFAWDPGCAADYLDLALTLAVKEAGSGLATAIDGLAPDAWHHDAVAQAFAHLQRLVATTQLREVPAARTSWAAGDGPLLHPAGATILRHTHGARDEGFLPVVSPVPTMSDEPALPFETARVSPEAPLCIPRTAPNLDGARALLRILLAGDTAQAFTTRYEVPSTVRGTTPTEQPPTLRTQVRLVADAGDHTIDWRFLDHYGLRPRADQLMTAFLRGRATPTATIAAFQSMADEVRADPDALHLRVS
ncbi:extracellular solute-binding protein [uncultured Tessaracoccus sp.]|uniref:extracellular solute-binding protein n=1 Tax=uncultured Tessaracoccus sp. TaxID=905023 RepID=UPI0025F5857D|nr:extracellular solute-binding protein [uncultured Tessaracoccus sp.]